MASMFETAPKLNDKAPTKQSAGITFVYVAFVGVALFIYHLMAEGEFSSILTLSAVFQCLAFSLLGLQMISPDGIRCISTKSLQLDALALICRLSSTTWLNGYLPNDTTGDYLYQAFDAISLAMVLWLIRRLQSTQQASHDEEFSIAPFAIGSLVLSFLLHGNLNDRPIFDALWMCSIFVSAVAVLPQLWAMTHSHKNVPALTCHFVAVMAFSRVLSGTYMWHAHSEITCDPWIGEFQHAGLAILAGHAVHLMLLGDFVYFYCKNLAVSGIQAPLTIPESFMV